MIECLSVRVRTMLRNMYAMLRYESNRTRTELNYSLWEQILATVTNGGGLD
jgi:hypothetical protein